MDDSDPRPIADPLAGDPLAAGEACTHSSAITRQLLYRNQLRSAHSSFKRLLMVCADGLSTLKINVVLWDFGGALTSAKRQTGRSVTFYRR